MDPLPRGPRIHRRSGVSGAGLAVLAGGLQSFRPELLDGVGVIVGIDRFMSEARAVTNFTGNAVATVLIGGWTGGLDKERAELVLSGAEPFDEVAFAAGDAHGGGAWDDELAELETEVAPVAAGSSTLGR